MDDKLVQVAGLLGKVRLAIAALLGGAELVLEERVVLRADDGKVVGHGWCAARPSREGDFNGAGRRENSRKTSSGLGLPYACSWTH